MESHKMVALKMEKSIKLNEIKKNVNQIVKNSLKITLLTICKTIVAHDIEF